MHQIEGSQIKLYGFFTIGMEMNDETNFRVVCTMAPSAGWYTSRTTARESVTLLKWWVMVPAKIEAVAD